MQKITPCIWFEDKCEEAINFYVSAFPNSKVVSIKRYPEKDLEGPPPGMQGKVLTGIFELMGQRFMALDGGDHFKLNPSISLTVTCKTAGEAEDLYKKLSEGGQVLMPFQQYPWSERYGWFNDKFGLSWQVNVEAEGGRIIPSLMFTGDKFGKVEEAIDFYVTTFKDAEVKVIAKYEEGEGNDVGKVKYSLFVLEDEPFIAMESSLDHKFAANGSISFSLECADQAEVDYYWEKLSANPAAEQCGWIEDKYGFSWQIVPKRLGELLSDTDKDRADRALQAMLKMKKIDVAELERAAGAQ